MLPPHSWLLFCLLALPSLVNGQSIRGQVVDHRSKEALIGANLRWLHHPDMGTTTDLDGSFELQAPQLPDTLLITYLGYQDWQRAVFPTDTFLNIHLKEDAQVIEQVMVVADRLPAKIFATEQLNRLDIYLNPAAKADVLLAVNSLPAATNPDETANVSLRGSPYEATGVFLNNIPLYDAVRLDQPNGIGQFSIFNTSTVTGLEVHPSNPPLHLGQAASGAVSIRTSDQIRSKARALNLHLAGGGLQYSQPVGKKSGLLAYANYGNQSFLKGANPNALEDIGYFRSFDGAAYFTHAFSERTQVRYFQLWISERYSYRLTSGRFRGFFNQNKDRQLHILNFNHRVRSWRFEWNQGFNWSKAHYELGNILTNLRQTDYHGNFMAHWRSGAWNGTLAAHYTLRQQKSAGTFPLYNGAWEDTDPSDSYEQEGRMRTPEFAAFAKRPLGQKFVLGLGSRLGYDATEDRTLWAAQAHLLYPINKRQSLTLAGGRYYQLTYPRGGSLSLQYNRSYQLALDWQYEHQRWSAQAAVYRHWGQWQSQNNAIYGAEGLLRYQAYPFQFWLSASHVSSVIETDAEQYPSAFDFAYLLRAGWRWELPAQFTLTGNWLLREGQYYQPLTGRQWEAAINAYLPIFAQVDQGERLSAFQRVDMGLSKTIPFEDSFLIAYLNVNNVLNRSNLRNYAFNQDYSQAFPTLYSQRIWFVGIVYQWE
ncbi:MAG: TonB-dependent receptor [Bacteroidota bacterium]